jgi:hypothetical protein
LARDLVAARLQDTPHSKIAAIWCDECEDKDGDWQAHVVGQNAVDIDKYGEGA